MHIISVILVSFTWYFGPDGIFCHHFRFQQFKWYFRKQYLHSSCLGHIKNSFCSSLELHNTTVHIIWGFSKPLFITSAQNKRQTEAQGFKYHVVVNHLLPVLRLPTEDFSSFFDKYCDGMVVPFLLLFKLHTSPGFSSITDNHYCFASSW